MMTEPLECPPLETLAAFIDGVLPDARRREVVAHVSRCVKCRFVVEGVLESEDDEADVAAAVTAAPIPFPRKRWLGVAAALMILIAGALVWRVARWRNDHLGQLAAAMPRTLRTIEPRLTGGFAWAPLRDLRRTNGFRKTAEDLVAAGAAGKTLRAIGDDREPDALHASGVAYLFTDQAGRAVTTLEEVTRLWPRDARAWSDLAAARYSDGAATADASQLRRALDAANRAIELEPDLAEAHFNRAVILERIGSEGQARWAWNQYLSLDQTSAWAAEARERRKSLAPADANP